MLTIRAQHLIRQLQEGDCSGSDLAQALHTSRRTVIRDVTTINAEFAEKGIGAITTDNGYHLEVQNTTKFHELLDGFRSEEHVVLFELLRHKTTTMSDLSEATYLSNAVLRDLIQKLNNSYHKALSIEVKSGEGVSLKIYKTSRIDLLAYLIREHREFGDASPVPVALITDSIVPAVQAAVPQRLFDYLTHGQLISQVTACAIGAQFADELKPEVKVDFSQNRKIPLSLQTILEHFYGVKVTLLNAMTVNTVREQVVSLRNRRVIEQHERPYINEIFNHLCRCAMFPTFVDHALATQIEQLEINNPFVFDLAFELTDKLSRCFPDVDIEPQFIALYTLHTVESPKEQNVAALLVFTQQAVGRINQMMIEEQVPNVDVEAISVADLNVEPIAVDTYDLILVNGRASEVRDALPRVDMYFNGIIGSGELTSLKRRSNVSFFEQNFATFFEPNHFIKLTPTSSDPLVVLADGLKRFVAAGQLSPSQADDLLAREQMGNQLIINTISVPHAKAEVPQSYSVFVIKPEPTRKLKVDDQVIKLFVCVLVKPDITDPGKIFTFIYQHLSSIATERLDQINSYSEMMTLWQ